MRALMLVLLITSLSAQELTLIPMESTWRYEDSGTDLGTAWRELAYDDSAWASGPAQLGVGDGDEATVVTRQPTLYFRHEFQVADPDAYVQLLLRLIYDDGAVVYLNGVEVWRENMPEGPISYGMFAAAKSRDNQLANTNITTDHLVAGNNVLAIEVHNGSGSSSDLSFDFSLTASDAVPPEDAPERPDALIRGPYLQNATPTEMTIRWRTDAMDTSRVNYGTEVDNLSKSVISNTAVENHELRLTGLKPDTVYYYDIGNDSQVLYGGTNFFKFRTPPIAGSTRPVRAWIIGDSGTASSSAAAVYDAYRWNTGADYTDLWIMLGDNAYGSGTDEEYQKAVFEMYPDLLCQTSLWSCLGNHDGNSASSWHQTGPYYDIFTLPAQGEAGGVKSETEAYYSFDYANIHFICLDSHETKREKTEAMYQWLEQDLEQNIQPWTIAFWHHPPYSKGNHDSDTTGVLVQMREIYTPLLENYNVDLVLCGHSHCYERSYFINGHDKKSDTYSHAEHRVQAGDGDPEGDGAYAKQGDANGGAVYVVAGSSGKTDAMKGWHPAMIRSMPKLGSVILEVSGNTLHAQFLRDTGEVQDTFQITKSLSTAGDADGDGIADDDDVFPNDPNEWEDVDGDGIGDNADTDDDNDGRLDDDDVFPNDPNEWEDVDGDGIGDNADTDDDNDGQLDDDDVFPNDPNEWEDVDGDGIGDNADTDDDNDGRLDDDDVFPNDPNEWEDVDGDGIGDNADTDDDNDGQADDVDPILWIHAGAFRLNQGETIAADYFNAESAIDSTISYNYASDQTLSVGTYTLTAQDAETPPNQEDVPFVVYSSDLSNVTIAGSVSVTASHLTVTDTQTTVTEELVIDPNTGAWSVEVPFTNDAIDVDVRSELNGESEETSIQIDIQPAANGG